MLGNIPPCCVPCSVRGERQAAHQVRIGGLVVGWLRTLQGLDDADVAEKEFSRLLAWAVVAEDSTDLLWKWFKDDTADFNMSATYQGDSPDSCGLRRRHDLLAGMINAHGKLSEDGTPVAALKCLAGAANLFLFRGGLSVIPFAGARLEVKRLLVSARCPAIDPQLYDRLVQIQLHLCERRYRTMERANLLLYHPMNADPRPFLAELRRY